jgi:hypothetical protein
MGGQIDLAGLQADQDGVEIQDLELELVLGQQLVHFLEGLDLESGEVVLLVQEADLLVGRAGADDDLLRVAGERCRQQGGCRDQGGEDSGGAPGGSP